MGWLIAVCQHLFANVIYLSGLDGYRVLNLLVLLPIDAIPLHSTRSSPIIFQEWKFPRVKREGKGEKTCPRILNSNPSNSSCVSISFEHLFLVHSRYNISLSITKRDRVPSLCSLGQCVLPKNQRFNDYTFTVWRIAPLFSVGLFWRGKQRLTKEWIKSSEISRAPQQHWEK